MASKALLTHRVAFLIGVWAMAIGYVESSIEDVALAPPDHLTGPVISLGCRLVIACLVITWAHDYSNKR